MNIEALVGCKWQYKIQSSWEMQNKTKEKERQVNEPKSEKPHPSTSIAQASNPASSSRGYVHLHSKQELIYKNIMEHVTTELDIVK